MKATLSTLLFSFVIFAFTGCVDKDYYDLVIVDKQDISIVKVITNIKWHQVQEIEENRIILKTSDEAEPSEPGHYKQYDFSKRYVIRIYND